MLRLETKCGRVYNPPFFIVSMDYCFECFKSDELGMKGLAGVFTVQKLYVFNVGWKQTHTESDREGKRERKRAIESEKKRKKAKESERERKRGNKRELKGQTWKKMDTNPSQNLLAMRINCK